MRPSATATATGPDIWFLRVGSFRFGGLKIRWSAATFALPLMLVSALGRLSEQVDVPAAGTVSGLDAGLALTAMVAALYAHEAAHVVAARAVGMPLAHVGLDTLIPEVQPDDDDPGSKDPARRFWFAIGGPLGDLLCGSVAAVIALTSAGTARFALLGYALGAGLQFLNALPTLCAGLLFTAAGLVMLALGGSVWVPAAVSLVLAGLVLLVVRVFRGSRRADGDMALAAWSELQTNKHRYPHG